MGISSPTVCSFLIQVNLFPSLPLYQLNLLSLSLHIYIGPQGELGIIHEPVLLFNYFLFWASMASATASTTAIPTLPATWKNTKPKHPRRTRLQVFAHVGTVDRRKRQRFPGVDTRIHWDNQNEGWLGGKTEEAMDEDVKKEDVRQTLNNLLKNTHSYYE